MTVSRVLRAALVAALALIALPALAADYPAPQEGDWIAKDFRFHTGDVMPSCACIIRPSARRPGSRC
jgi:homoserine O-acetyltransferase